jgi:predicted nucleic acid-binding Zn ribbon protein
LPIYLYEPTLWSENEDVKECCFFEVIQSFKDEPLQACPTCGHKIHRAVTSFSVTNKTKDSSSSENELYFKSVSQDRATIIWRLSISKWKILSGKKSEEYAPKINENNQVEVEFTLKPNQTFILSSNKVADGRAVDSINRKK